MRQLFFISRLLHKYIGLFLFAVLLFMAVTGILLNHPSVLARWDVPQQILGDSYRYHNWNRFSFRDGLVLADGTVIIAGKSGVFKNEPEKKQFIPINSGLPKSLYLRDTYSIIAVPDQGSVRLYAGTRAGLYTQRIEDRHWKQVKTPSGNEHIVDLVVTDEQMLAFTPRGCLVANMSMTEPVFRKEPITFLQESRKIPGYRLLFSLHSGKLFGIKGKLLVDFIAIGLVFLCLSAFYLWLFKKKHRFFYGKVNRKLFAFSFREHLRIGIWISFPLLIIALSGTFIRPPLIILADSLKIPESWLRHEAHEIVKAEIIDKSNLIVATRDGWYRGKADLSKSFERFTPPFPVFAMGPTALAKINDNTIAAGSFSGLFYWNIAGNIAVDLQGAQASDTSTMRPAKVMAAGVLIKDETLVGYADYRKGFQQIEASPWFVKEMWPEELSFGRISLYHFLFELHNGRFLRDCIGTWYILFVPLTGFLFIIVIISGVFDWCWHKRKKQAGGCAPLQKRELKKC